MVWRPVPVGEEVLSRAFSIEDRFSLSFWDSLVVSAAQVTRCDMLLTEDLQTTAQIDGVMIVDPFSTAVGGGI
jgi:predicted nucleic acid-binding protein